MGDGSKQLRLPPECSHQGRASLHRSQAGAGVVSEVLQIASTEVGHRVRLEITPNALDRIELGGIGRQVLQGDRAALLLDVFAHESGAMSLQAVPYDQQLPTNRGRECLEELNYLRAPDRAREQTEVKAQPAHPGNRRQLLPAEAVLQDRCLSARSPGACAAGTFGQTRLVYEDDDSSLPRGDFFSSGHLLCFQVEIARSSRCRAWPVGRCTLHPIRRSSPQTELLANRTPNFSWISAAMRGSVQISVAYPAASAPFLKRCASSCNWVSDSRGGRPRDASRATRSKPPASTARSQRITDWRDTPIRRATSAGATPLSSRRAPLTRRRRSCFLRCLSSISTPHLNMPQGWTANSEESVTHLVKYQ